MQGKTGKNLHRLVRFEDTERVALLIGIMVLVVVVSEAAALSLLYRASVEEQRTRLYETVLRQSSLMESVARFDSLYSSDFPGGSREATLSQLHSAQLETGRMGNAEISIAEREGDDMVFLLGDISLAPGGVRLPLDGDYAGPMQRALRGESGTMIGLDYRGVEVLAAYRPVRNLGFGLVAKVAMVEIRAPFIRAGVFSGLIGLGLIVVSAVAFVRVTQPIILRGADLARRHRATFEQAAVGMAHIDLNDRILMANWRLCEMLGYAHEDLIGRTIVALTYPDDREADQEYARKVQVGELDTYIREKRYVRRDGSLIWANISSSVIRNQLAAPDYRIAVIEDITRRVDAETQLKRHLDSLEETVRERTAELEEANRQLERRTRLAALGQLSASIGHELRNPLGVISNAVYYLQMVVDRGNDNVREYLQIIDQEVNRSDQIISDLLGLARTPTPRRQPVPVPELVAQVLAAASLPPTVQADVQVEGAPVLLADPGHLQIVLVNLVRNAVQAMPQGGTLRIAARARGGCVELSVADTGAGIGPDNLKQIFEPLFTTKARGIGLGLAMSKNLVEANGGAIRVESEPGKGATFTIDLCAQEAGT